MVRMSWIAGLLLAASGASAAESPIEAGLYEIVTKTSIGPAQTERKCLTSAEIAKGLQPSLDPSCKLTRSTVAGGRIDFAATCPDMTMATTGSYTATSYQIDGKVQIKAADDPMTIESHITGKKVGACKAS